MPFISQNLKMCDGMVPIHVCDEHTGPLYTRNHSKYMNAMNVCATHVHIHVCDEQTGLLCTRDHST